ncbi:MAG: pyrroline-5-carboxylate reductase [Elainellaceae cyanobacterium]
MVLGVIGGGVMGEALMRRLIERSIYVPQDIFVSEPRRERLDYLRDRYGIRAADSSAAVAAEAQVLLLAVKPQVFDAVAKTLGPEAGSASAAATLIVSILAGIPLSRLEAAFPGHPVVRAMPNTPATVGAGITALAGGAEAIADHLAQATRLFSAVGQVVQVPESLMDAVTGLSGSGPGYIAVVIEALTDGGVAVGLPRATAAQLAVQTVRGTAELLASGELHPAELKDRVTSPGGTTIAGVARLEQAGLRSALIEAVRAAYQRSRELGES